MESEPTEGSTRLLERVAFLLGTVPAYVLVFGIAFMIIAFGAISLSGWRLVMVSFGILFLAGSVIYLVETLTSVSVKSASERDDIARIAAERHATKVVLGMMLDNNNTTWLVYSSHPVRSLPGADGKLRRVFEDEAVLVSTTDDAQGAARIQSLLLLAGKSSDRLQYETANTVRPASLDDGLVLVGGGPANPHTAASLELLPGHPFEFSEDDRQIIDNTGSGPPLERSKKPRVDYGILAKINVGNSVRIVAAGIGSPGTRGCCEY